MKQADPIKLLEFTTVFAIGGTERHVVSLVQGVDRSRFEVHMACLKRWGELLKEIETLQLPLAQYDIDSLYTPRAFQERLRFARYVRQYRIQIVHTYNFYANVFALPAATLAGTPVIVASIRDTGAYLTPMQGRVQRWTCRVADCVLVNAEAIRQWLISQGYNPAKIAVIRNGIDLSRFEGRHDGGGLRRELGLPAGAPLVAVLSRLEQLKGVEYFLQSATIVAGRFPEARFLIVGDGHCRKALEAYAVRLGLGNRVVFTGFRVDVPELLSEVAISVLPSLSEGLSNVLLESMAVGVPVVATTVGGNPEAIDDGVTGLLVPPRESGALARAICLLLENRELAARFGRAGRQRVVERFSRERMVRETERLYVGLLEKARRRKVAGVSSVAGGMAN